MNSAKTIIYVHKKEANGTNVPPFLQTLTGL